MALKKAYVILFFLTLTFTGCQNMCTELEDTIGSTCWTDRLYWEDVSDRTYDFSGGSGRYSMITEDGKPVVKVTSGSGNWTLDRDTKGFECDVKCASGASITGFELFSATGFSCFEVYITDSGTVQVRYVDKNNKTNRLFTSGKIIEDITVYNTLSMVLQKDRSVNVYVNGTKIYTIKGYSINYGILCTQMNSKGTSYYKIRKIMH